MAIQQEGITVQVKEALIDDYLVISSDEDLPFTLSLTPKSVNSRFKVKWYLPTWADGGSGYINPYFGMWIQRRINSGSWENADMLGEDTSGNARRHGEISPYRNEDNSDRARQGTRYRTKNNCGFIIDKPNYNFGDTIEYKIRIDRRSDTARFGPANANRNNSYFSQPYGLIVEEISSGFTPNIGYVADGSSPEKAAPSAKYIKDQTGTTSSGVYWILINTVPTQLYCDMNAIDGGGWTLIGKSGGGSWHDPDGWLKSNSDENTLQDLNNLGNNEYSCIDARVLASVFSRECALSNHDLSRWVRAPFHSQTSPGTIFNHKLTADRIFDTVDDEEGSESITARAYNGETTSGFVNKFAVMALPGHGGSTPAWTRNTRGNTAANEWNMAVACANTDHNGFNAANNFNGQDAPFSDTDWPNAQYNGSHYYGCIWVR